MSTAVITPREQSEEASSVLDHPGTAATASTGVAAPRTTPESDRRPAQQPPHAVVLHNDNRNTFEFVVATLRRIFGYSMAKAYDYTLRAHTTGRCVVWSGMKEHAEFKADQIRACGRDPMMAAYGAAPLRVTIEPTPG